LTTVNGKNVVIKSKRRQFRVGYYALDDFEKMRAVCEGVGEAVKNSQDCLAPAYHKLGRQVDAETALARFKALERATPVHTVTTQSTRSGQYT
jgi:hypothetical protein